MSARQPSRAPEQRASFLALVRPAGLRDKRTAVSAVADLMIRDHVKRLVAVLLWLADARTISPEGSGAIEVEASQSDLATMANVARTTANATLRRLVSARQVKLASPLCP
jgi:CRP-like cAMP-binding protein